MLQQVSAVFGTPLSGVRHMRTPKKTGEGTVFVMSAIDLVMVARGCDYKTAQYIIFRIFKDYYNVDLEAENPVGNQVNEETSCLLMYRVRFLTGDRGGSSSLALDVQGAGELLCVIPGSDFGAAVRRRAVDALLRIEGADESLIDRIKANRKFQEYLTGLLGRERPDTSLGKPLYCSRFLQDKLFLKDWAAKERAKVFGNDVKTSMRTMFPEYDLEARTNRSVNGHDREPHLYFEAHFSAFLAALPKYVARAAAIKEDELTCEGLQNRRACSEENLQNFFRSKR